MATLVHSYRWVMLALAWTVAFFTYATPFSVPPLLSDIARDLEASFTEIGIVFALPILMIAIFAPVGGWLVDRIGVRNTTGTAILLVSIGGASRAVAADLPSFLTVTAIAGVGWAFMLSNLSKLVGGWFPRQQLGLASGIYISGASAGISLALVLAIPLTDIFSGGWRAMMLFWGLLAFVTTALWFALAREPKPLMIKSKSLAVKSVSSSIVSNWRLWLLAAILFLWNLTFYIETNWFPAFFAWKGASESTAALISSVLTWVGIPALIVGTLSSDRVGRRKPFLVVTAVVSTISTASLAITPLQMDWFAVAAMGVVTYIGFVMCLMLPAELVEPSSVGRATGLVLGVAYVGGVLGPALIGYLRDFTGGFSQIPTVLAVSSLILVVLSALMPETGPKAKIHL